MNLIVVAIGAGYGLFFRLLGIPGIANKVGNIFVVMTWGFLFGVPCVMGYFAVMTRCKLSNGDSPGVLSWIVFPWIPATAAILGTLALMWEGYICLLFALPSC